MKRLFGEDDRYLLEALELEYKLLPALQDIFKEWTGVGYSVRDISHLLVRLVVDIECETMLGIHEGKG